MHSPSSIAALLGLTVLGKVLRRERDVLRRFGITFESHKRTKTREERMGKH